jgi:hypothetical protein
MAQTSVKQRRNQEVSYARHRKGTLEVKPRQTERLNDPRFGLHNLLECVFHESRNLHLAHVAERILLHVKSNGGLEAGDWRKFLELNRDLTYSNYQSALQKLRSIGLLRREHGRYRLGPDFSTFLNNASSCWTRFLSP